jgi:hypothetical protein
MKKLLISLLICSTAHAAPHDLSIGQYDHFGTSILNRLTPLPSGGGVDGVLVYDQAANLPKIATLSGCSLSSGVLTCTGTAPAWGALTGTPPNVSVFTNDSGYITSSALSPYATTAALTSGLSTKFDTPTGTTAQYLRGDGSVATYSPGTGTVTSITAGTGLSGGTITTTGTISMPNTGTAGTYTSSYTTDAQGRITAAINRSQSAQTRTLNSGFQISSTRDALAIYSVQATVTASIGGGQDGDVFLEIASDSGFTTNLQTISVAPCSQTYTLAVALQGVQKCSLNVSGYVPAAYYTRLRTANNTGTPAFLYRAGLEVLI